MSIDFSENKQREIKSIYTDSVLKTVSAFSNYEGGKIFIGLDEKNQSIVGVDHYLEVKMMIENKINDSITPRPQYEIHVIQIDNKYLLEIDVAKQTHTPYLYKGVAYQRKDTSTLPVDQIGLVELSLAGKNLSYDQLESDVDILSFTVLEKKLIEVKSIQKISNDLLITLGLYKHSKYTIAAELLADHNHFTDMGIDIVRFGKSISQFADRKKISGVSILTQYDEAINMFKKHYSSIDTVEGLVRIKKAQIPYEAFRESVANAIAHRDYLIKANIKIEMYDNRIEVISPGGLPLGMTKDNYIHDNLSIPRNTTVSFVLYTLNIIERFGTGIRRINEAYNHYPLKPTYIIKDNLIKVILPNLLFDDRAMKDEMRILNLLDIKNEITRSDVERLLEVGKSTATQLLKELVDRQLIDLKGTGKNILYYKK